MQRGECLGALIQARSLEWDEFEQIDFVKVDSGVLVPAIAIPFPGLTVPRLTPDGPPLPNQQKAMIRPLEELDLMKRTVDV